MTPKSVIPSGDQLDEKDYILGMPLFWALNIFAVGFMILGFALHSPLENFIDQNVKKFSKVSKTCVLSPNNLRLAYFPLPKIKMDSLNIPQGCTGQEIKIHDLAVGPVGLSFSPFGLKFNLSGEVSRKNDIDIDLSVGFNAFKVIVDDTKINLSKLPSSPSVPIKLKGDLSLNAFIEGSFKKINTADIKIISENAVVPAQNVMGFNIPSIKLFPVKFYGTMKKNGTIKFSKISTGEKEDTFISKAEGKIITNKRNFKNSTLEIIGQFKFPPAIKKELSFIEVFLGKPRDNGYFGFKIGGMVGSATFRLVK